MIFAILTLQLCNTAHTASNKTNERIDLDAALQSDINMQVLAGVNYKTNQVIDIDAALQRDIDMQVLVGVKQERVKQYCIDQSAYQDQFHTPAVQEAAQRAAAQRGAAQAVAAQQIAQQYQLLPPLSLCDLLYRMSINM